MKQRFEALETPDLFSKQNLFNIFTIINRTVLTVVSSVHRHKHDHTFDSLAYRRTNVHSKRKSHVS